MKRVEMEAGILHFSQGPIGHPSIEPHNSNGPDPKNSCRTCKFWWHGKGVAHNHCDCAAAKYWMDSYARANGRYSIKKTPCAFRVRGKPRGGLSPNPNLEVRKE